ncbi:tetratricopeptide repeat protein [Gracilimonas halophila]|uniref:Tetratricopeptide repeat protein n=1 Tax=Gracilimonas halophila TaxID=1834464 RepID=A0ABW5JDT7_9BACT
MKFYSACLLIIIASLPLLTIDVAAQDKLLGKIDFPNSGAEEAQDNFIEGVKFLHNFEYADAARAFKRARQIDPDFVMAHYGEAKSHNHPIWFQQDRQAAMEVLNNLGETVESRQSRAVTQREKDLLMSLEILYGNTPESEDVSKEERDDLYMAYMAELHEKYPGDHEITAFYGLSILGSAHEGRDFSIYMRAAAELFDVWNENPEHPGAAHYLIHSFDDPVHAPLGLPMAKAYSKIAPAAAHAQHMTSHIFLALGMWDGVIDANIVARDVQTTRQKELNEEPTVCGHYTWWLQYGYLQAGEVENATKVLKTCTERIKAEPSSSEKWHFAIMRGHQIVDTENWKRALEWTSDFEAGTRGAVNYFFTTALANIKTGNIQAAQESLDQLMKTPVSVERDIQVDQIQSLLMIEEGNTREAVELLNQAVVSESELPLDFGPPVIIKPSYELLGDVMMEMGNYEEALDAYQNQLERTPDRMRSLVGKEQALAMISKQ